MPYLLDTNLLVRMANALDPNHAVATRAVSELHRRGESVYVTAQVLIEFRSTGTRPLAVNGLGLTTAEVERLAAIYEARFPLLPETPDIYPAWKDIVQALGVIGRQVHDARLVAVCHVHGITHLLTFNVAHFNRLAAFGPGVTVVDPATV
jgi:predicted nucleic acid-binding protein